MPSTYNFIKFVHVLLAIIAVGFNASYGIWLSRAAKEPQHESYALRTVKILDDRFANPATSFYSLPASSWCSWATWTSGRSGSQPA